MKGTITARGSTPKAITTFSPVQVYSVSPTLTVKSISPSGTVQINPAGDIWSVPENQVLSGKPYYGTDHAVVYMGYEVNRERGEYTPLVAGKPGNPVSAPGHENEYARYTPPKVTLAISNLGADYPATLTLSGDDNITISHEFTGDSGTWDKISIGTVEEGTNSKYTYTDNTGRTYPLVFRTQKVGGLFGTHTVEAVKTTVGKATFTRTLTKPVTISQQNKPVTAQKLTYTEPTGVTVAVTADGTIPSGGTVKPLMPVKVTLTAKEGYCKPQLSQPKGVYHWTVVSETADRAEYTFNMAFTATSLTPSVSEYPRITFQADSTNASIQVTAGGKSQASGNKLKAGTPVTVTVTAKKEAGYCLPELRPSVPVTWETISSTDFETVYTFNMPTENVTLAANTTQMHPIHFDAAAKLQFVGMTQSQTAGGEIALKNGDYAIPGRLITVTAVAVGGTNPQMTVSPAAVKLEPNTTDEEATSRIYTFTMPQAAVTLSGTCTPAPVRTLQYSEKGNDFARIARVSVNGSPAEPVTAEGVSSVSAMVGAKVEITLATNDGYYAPRMPSQPVNGLTFAGPTLAAVDKDPAAHYGEATYSFTMPKGSDTEALDLTKIAFTAKEAPKISVKKNANSDGGYVSKVEMFSIAADGKESEKKDAGKFLFGGDEAIYDNLTSAAPGTKLRVAVYSPVSWGCVDDVYLTAVGATLGERQQKDSEISYYFTMGTEPVMIEIHPGK